MFKKLVYVALATAIVLPLALQASAQLSDDDRKCQDKVLNRTRSGILGQQTKYNRKECVKDQTGDRTACVNTEAPKAADKRAQLITDMAAKCSTLPPFGVNGDPNAIADAAEDAAGNVIKAVFGDPVTLDTPATKCNDKMSQRPGQLAVAQWKAVRGTLKDLASIPDIAAVETGIGTGIAAGTSAKGGKVSDDYDGKCGGTIPPNATDGACGGVGDANFDECVINNTECEVCLALNTTTNANADCDLIDDGLANGSCGCPPPLSIGTHACTIGGTSGIVIHTQLFPLNFPATGSLQLTCGTTGCDGKASCDCAINNFDPINIPAIGFVCITADPNPCDPGEIDCNGGNALGIGNKSDAIVGTTCDGNEAPALAPCDAMCDTQCATLPGYSQLSSGCVNYCNGGTNDNLPCLADSDCPLGSCNGKDDGGAHAGVCQCQCINTAAGGAGDAGEFQCNLPANLVVEASAPCNGTDVLINVGKACVPLSTQSASTEIADLNYGAVPLFGPFAANGSPFDCTSLAGSNAAAGNLKGVVNFFGSSLGDLAVELGVDCQ